MPPKLNITEFSAEYVMDIPEIDEQHKVFLSMLGEIDAASSDLYKPMDDDEVDNIVDVLDKLRDYALLHFRTEESFMAEIDYPGLPLQKKAHNRFITDVIRLEAELLNGSSMPAITIRNFIHEWYHAHIIEMDKPFGAFHKENSE